MERHVYTKTVPTIKQVGDGQLVIMESTTGGVPRLFIRVRDHIYEIEGLVKIA